MVTYYGNENLQIVQEYIDFLLEHNFAFYCSEEELTCFPLIDISEFHTPFPITNAIIELEKIVPTNILSIISQLNSVACPAIEIRLFSEIAISELEMLLSIFGTPDVELNEVHIIALYNENWEIAVLKNLFILYPRLCSIVISNAPDDERHTDFYDDISSIVFTKRKVHLATCCGNFATENFVPNLPFFTESQHHNTCLHRKVAIDRKGDIKNCPSMTESFGNIDTTNLVDVIDKKEFTAKWTINKDKISICKDCEFRHVCMDCRAYLEDPEDIYSKPLKCGYNPYSMEWNNWTIDSKKKEAIEFYNLKDI